MSNTGDDIGTTTADTAYLHTLANGDGVDELARFFSPLHSLSSDDSFLAELHTLQAELDSVAASGTRGGHGSAEAAE